MFSGIDVLDEAMNSEYVRAIEIIREDPNYVEVFVACLHETAAFCLAEAKEADGEYDFLKNKIYVRHVYLYDFCLKVVKDLTDV
jgi:hypothetical protein